MTPQVGLGSTTDHRLSSAPAQCQDLSDLDKAVLSTIELREGKISLSEVTTLLGISAETLGRSIERLQNFHLIGKQVSDK